MLQRQSLMRGRVCAGLLGAVEGLSFLALLAGAVVLGLTVKTYGSIPEAVPVEGGRCSGI